MPDRVSETSDRGTALHYLGAQFALNFVSRKWFGDLFTADGRRYIVPLVLGLYLAHRQGRLVTKKDALTLMLAEHSSTSQRHIEALQNLKLVTVERSEVDKRQFYIVATPLLLNLVEDEIEQVNNEVAEGAEALKEEATSPRLADTYRLGWQAETNALRRVAARSVHWSRGYAERPGTSDVTYNTERAIADFSEAIRLMDKNPKAWLNRAEAGRFVDADQSIADYSRAIELDPAYLEAHAKRLFMYRLAKKDDEALRAFDDLLGIDPNNADRYLSRGEFHRDRGNREAAVADLRRAHELGHPAAKQLLARLGVDIVE